MKTLVDWVLAQRYRSIILAMALAPLLPVVTAALMALETMRRGVSQGLLSAAAGISGMLLLALITGGNVAVYTALGLTSFLCGVAIGALLRWAGTLTLTFQGTLLSCAAVVAVMSLLDPSYDLLAPAIDDLIQAMRANGADEAQIALVQGQGGMVLLIAALFLLIVASLLLAYWWLGLARDDTRFGVEFRQLALGRVLGIPATVLVGLSLVFDAALVQNLTPLALLGFLFQGFAVMHAWAYAKRWHAGFIAPVYVLLVTPLMVVVVLGLSAVGLIDNWFDLRAPLRSQL